MGRKDKAISFADIASVSIGAKLRYARQIKGISLTEMAEKLGYTKGYLSGAENGSRPASKELIERYEETLGLKLEGLSKLSQSQPPTRRIPSSKINTGSLIRLWHLTRSRSAFFTGREAILQHLHDTLNERKSAALTQPQAISGLGGIGKTLTAIEFAYRYRDEYQTVLWVRANTRETLISDFVAIATLLNLPEKDAQDQSHTVSAVNHWLETHSQWLLIIDNADDLELARDFLPTSSKGHVIITTRSQATGEIAQPIEITKLEPDDGALFLLHRARIIPLDASLADTSDENQSYAGAIVNLLDGLPLAIDQAGAYIEETGCGLAAYLERYQFQHAKLLQLRGGLSADHPEPVATTWKLSFRKVEMANPAAADLLRLFAFLSPDSIPEEFITEGAPDFGPLLQLIATDAIELDNAIRELRKYSLVHRDIKNQTVTIHRLVQAVLKDEMSEDLQHHWAESVVRAMNRIFPNVEVETWPRCQRYLPHALMCSSLIAQWNLSFPEAARLLHQAGSYLEQRARYAEAEPLYQRALAIREKVLGPEHPDTAATLNNLAELYREQGKYEQAEPLAQRALAIREQVLRPEHPDTANSLENLAELYQSQAKYEQVESLAQRILETLERAPKQDHPTTATTLNSLAGLYRNQGKYEQAEPLYQRALAIYQQVRGSEHPYTATTLNNLARLYYDQGKYEQAEPLYQRALAIREKMLGADHPNTATSLNSLALLYHSQGKYEQAEPLYQRALTIYEKKLGADHPNTRAVEENYIKLRQEIQHQQEQ